MKNALLTLSKVTILSAFFIVISFHHPSHAYLSSNVPLDHWSYGAIERLVASGIIDTVTINAKPWSRLEIAEALSRVPRTISVSSRILRQDISRLAEEYEYELSVLGKFPLTGGPGWYRIADPLSWEIIYADIGIVPRAPRENYWGGYFYNGSNQHVFFRAWASVHDHIVIDVAPRFSIYANNQDATLQEAYIKTTFSNVDLEIGRDALWWGPGYHGSLILSNNAPPFNFIKFESHRPFVLPGVFRILGPLDISTFLTQLEADRDFPEAMFFGLRLGLVPARFMEINLTRSIIFAGKGRPALDSLDYMKVFLAIGENNPGKLNNDQLAGLDIRIGLPVNSLAAGLSIYGQLIGEDEAGGLPSSHGYLGGVLICDLFYMGLFDLRVEYAEHPIIGENAPWYSHSVYTKGYTYDKRVIGHPMGGFEDDYFNGNVFMGSDAWDIFLETVIHAGENMSIVLQYDHERHRSSAPAIETKQEVIFNITGRLTEMVVLHIGQEYERIQNWRGAGDGEINNYYIWGRVEVTY